MRQRTYFYESEVRDKLYKILEQKEPLDERLEFTLKERGICDIVDALIKREDCDDVIFEFFRGYPNKEYILQTIFSYKPFPSAFQRILVTLGSALCHEATTEKITSIVDVLHSITFYSLVCKHRDSDFTISQIFFGLGAALYFEPDDELVKRTVKASYLYRGEDLDGIMCMLGASYFCNMQEQVHEELAKLGIQYKG